RGNVRPGQPADRTVLGPGGRAHLADVQVAPVLTVRIDRVEEGDVVANRDLELAQLVVVGDVPDEPAARAARGGVAAVLVDPGMEGHDRDRGVPGVADLHGVDLDDQAFWSLWASAAATCRKYGEQRQRGAHAARSSRADPAPDAGGRLPTPLGRRPPGLTA